VDLSQPEPILLDHVSRQPMPKQHQPTDHGGFDVMLHWEPLPDDGTGGDVAGRLQPTSGALTLPMPIRTESVTEAVDLRRLSTGVVVASQSMTPPTDIRRSTSLDERISAGQSMCQHRC